MAARRMEASDDVMWAGLPSPASQPWHNSAFAPDGSLKSCIYGTEPQRIAAACDELGMVVILGYFYFGQDERLTDEAAVCHAVDGATQWVLQSGYRNVLIEINNETNVPRYEHEILQPHRVAELIDRARSHELDGRRLLVGTSYGGGSVPDDDVVAASDYIMLHGNGVTQPARIAEMVAQTRALPSYTAKTDSLHRGRSLRIRRARQQLPVCAVGLCVVGLLRSRGRGRRFVNLRRLPRWLSEHPGQLGHQHGSQAQLLQAAGASHWGEVSRVLDGRSINRYVTDAAGGQSAGREKKDEGRAQPPRRQSRYR